MSAPISVMGGTSKNSELQSFEVRYVDVDKDTAKKIFPFVLSSLNVVGIGSAVRTDAGIQITAPVDLLHNLLATVEKYKANPRLLLDRKFYDPFVLIPGYSSSLKPLVEALNLCPPDMCCDWIQIRGFGGLLAFSGPPDRQDDYRGGILPSVTAILPPIKTHVFFDLIEVPKTTPNFKEIVDGLGLCPLDIQTVVFDFPGAVNSRLGIAGAPDRLGFYNSDVKQNLKAIVGLLMPALA